MTYPTITPLPPYPTRGEPREDFATKANNTVAAMPDFITETNAAGAFVEAKATETANASAIAVGAANFKGEWSTLTGPLAIPASVSHTGAVWILTVSLADVTAKQPGVDPEWLQPSGLADGQVTTAKIADGALSADVSGRAKMADSFVNSAKLDAVALKNGSTATTQSASDNSTKVATTEYVDAQSSQAVSDVIKSGAIVKSVITGNASVVTANGSTPDDDTIPLVSEGTQVISAAFAMSNASDMVEVSVSIPGASNNAVHFIVALYAGSTCIGAQRLYASTAAGKNLTCTGFHTPGSTASITYSARVGNGLGATFYTNADNTGSRVLGSISRTVLTVKQLKA